MNEASKHTTVEGHPIVRDGEYETRGGRKAIILGFVLQKGHSGVVGYVADGDWNPVDRWCAEVQGFSGHIACDNDLMRPWKDKPSRTIKPPPATGKVSIKAVREAVKAIKDKPDAEGWIKWEGGEQPLYSCDFVEVKLQDGRTLKSRTNCFYWADVIAYRIVEEPKKPKKQTLLEFFYEGQETCGVVERNLISKISEWAELYLENKED